MGWKAGNKTDDAQGGGAAVAKATSAARGGKKKRGVILILLGLVLTGVAAGWSWLRRMPKSK